MSYFSHRSFAILALENYVTFFLLLTGSPAEPARKNAGKIAPVLSSKSRTPARTAASLDVIFPLRSPHDSDTERNLGQLLHQEVTLLRQTGGRSAPYA